MNYSRQTVDQIKESLKLRGVVFPSKAKKAELVAMLVEAKKASLGKLLELEDGKKKQDAAGGASLAKLLELEDGKKKQYAAGGASLAKLLQLEDGKKKQDAAGGGSKVDLSEASGSLPKASGASFKDNSKQSVDQMNKSLKKRGLSLNDFEVFPSKAKKTALVTMLVEEDGKKKQDGTGGGSKVNLTESSGSLPKASGTSSKEEAWIIETKLIYSRCRDEPHINIVGIFTSKEEAIKNAKIAFANMDYFEDADGWDNKQLEDYSEKIDKKFDKGCKGGVLFQMDTSVEGDAISVSIYKCFIDKPIKSIDKAMDYDDADSEEDDIANSDDDESEYE